jgi:1-deoxy-D-xylulose-5-phosphate synthase
VNDIIYLRHMPHMIVMAPKDENELQRMLKSALGYGHPTAIRFPKGRGPGAALDEDPLEIAPGESERLKDGKHLLLAYGSMVRPAFEAAAELEKEGLSLAVINARFAKPLDEPAILPFAEAGNAVITVEEGVVSGGFGSAVRELLDRERRFDIRFLAVGLPPEVYPLGKADEIRRVYGLDPAGLADRIRRFFRG